MLKDIKSRLNEEGIKEIIGMAVFPDPDKIQETAQHYWNDEQMRIMGYESEGDIIGIVGYRFIDKETLEIKHIAVIPEERGKDFGRGMILEVLELEKPQVIIAETDEDAVEFYRAIGFMIESVGEKYPGTERFKCTFFTED